MEFLSRVRLSKVFLIVWVIAAVSCGPVPTLQGGIEVATTSCQSGAAEILVGDGFLQILCGCMQTGETPGRIYSTPGNLTCHLAVGTTTVFFVFSGTVLQHQIVSTGANSFGATPIIDPNDGVNAKIYAVTFPQSTLTYGFQEVFSGMTGQIFVP